MNITSHIHRSLLVAGAALLLGISCGKSDDAPAPDKTAPEKPVAPTEPSDIAPAEGMTLYGLVADTDGNPLEGVVVSRRLRLRRHRRQGRLSDQAPPFVEVRLSLDAVGL